jgi:hypothetical protein
MSTDSAVRNTSYFHLFFYEVLIITGHHLAFAIAWQFSKAHADGTFMVAVNP